MREPWQSLIADIPDIAVALRNQITRDVGGSAYVVGKDTVVLFRLPLPDNIISHQRKRNPAFRKCRQKIAECVPLIITPAVRLAWVRISGRTTLLDGALKSERKDTN